MVTTVRVKARGDQGRAAGTRWPSAAGGAVVVVGIAVTTTTVSHSIPERHWFQILVLAWGIAVLVPAVLMWARASSPYPGRLMVVLAGAYYLQFLRSSDDPFLFAAGFCAAFLWTAVLGHLLLTWPTGRITDRLQRIMIPAGYAAAVASQIARYLTERPCAPWPTFSPPPCAVPQSIATYISTALFAAFSLSALVIVLHRWMTSNRLRRRPSGPIWASALVASLISVAAALSASIPSWHRAERPIVLVGLVGGLVAIPAVYGVLFVRIRGARWDLASIALRFPEAINRRYSSPDPAHLQKALADAVGDPSLRLVYRLRGGSFVDIHGQATTINPERATSSVRRRGRLLAVIEHDHALAHDRAIAEATNAAAGLAIDYAQLFATMQAQIEQVRASRLRLATAALEERQRIQRDLHDGAQQSLLAVLVLLDMAGLHLAADDPDRAGDIVGLAHRRLAEAIGTLREFTERIYPAALIEHGLGQAIEPHADTSPIPLTINVIPGRWPLPVETTAYFVICESLANTYKHAHATQVKVTVERRGDQLIVEIVDNGLGGARILPGHGLAGLQDRVAAIGGTLRVAEQHAGTRLIAHLPLEDL